MSPEAEDRPPPRRRWTISLQDLVDNGLLQPGQEIRFEWRDIRAQVTSKGTVMFNGTEYPTLSAAAKSVRGTSLNGWLNWGVQTNGGRWMPLADLREKLI